MTRFVFVRVTWMNGKLVIAGSLRLRIVPSTHAGRVWEDVRGTVTMLVGNFIDLDHHPDSAFNSMTRVVIRWKLMQKDSIEHNKHATGYRPRKRDNYTVT